MKRHFFITGLPRCRSAWLANLLTWGDSFCWHDILSSSCDTSDCEEILTSGPWLTTGISDPASLLHWRGLAEVFPGAKWIIIERPFEESFQSCQKAFGWKDRSILWKLNDNLDALKQSIRPMAVPFKDLSKIETVRSISKHLNVDVGSMDRIECLQNLNVQANDVAGRAAEIIFRNPQWLNEVSMVL